MACKICDRFWDQVWESSDAWERQHSNESELLSKESEQNWELIQQAAAVEDSDTAAAFRLYLEAAEAGSPWAIHAVAWRYWTGTGVVADPTSAEDFFRRAIGAGSWMATIHYARMLEEYHHQDECEQVLMDGVDANFTPAFFWLARIRYERCKTRKTAREISPMLEHAARKGHPRAQVMLAHLMLRGKLGLGRIPTGLTMAVQAALKYAGAPKAA